MISVIDIGFGNIDSILDGFRLVGVDAKRLNKPSFDTVNGLVLPGVGNFDSYMRSLSDFGWTEKLRYGALSIPLLGICVGMHALAEESEEGTLLGLGLIPGQVRKIQCAYPLPHMGWNSVIAEAKSTLFAEVDMSKGFYFLHNYAFNVRYRDNLIASCDYGTSVCSAVANNYIYGVQFHPEKSHQNGLKIFKNFSEIVANASPKN